MWWNWEGIVDGGEVGAGFKLTDRFHQTGGVRFYYIGSVWLETDPNRLKLNLNLKVVLQPVRTDILAG